MFKLVIIFSVVPESDGLVQGTRYDAGASSAIPIDTIDLGCVRADGLDGFRSFPVIPNVKEPVMS
jgi:hypothetical protein